MSTLRPCRRGSRSLARLLLLFCSTSAVPRFSWALLEEIPARKFTAPGSFYLEKKSLALTASSSAPQRHGQRFSRQHPSHKNLSRRRGEQLPFANKNTDEPNPSWSTVRFNKWLHQYVVNSPSSAEEAERILLQRLETCNKCDSVSFNIVLNAWARQRSTEAARRADALLQRLVSQGNNGNTHKTTSIQPDAYSYSAVLNAHAKSGGGRMAALRAQAILLQMEQQTSLLKTDLCYNIVLDAWVLSNEPERAELLLQQLIQKKLATRISYNTVLKGWCRVGSGPRAQRLLDEMQAAQDMALRPDKISYSTCMDAWAKTKNCPDAAQCAEALLQKMEQLYQQTGDPTIQPDVVAYTTVLNAYAQECSHSYLPTGFSLNRVLDLVRRMQATTGQKPNATFWNSFIHLLAKHRHSKRGKLAVTILRYMQKQPHVRPCKITYTAVISALAKEGSAAEAEQLLDELIDLWECTNDVSYLPNAKTFAACLHAWARSKPSSPLLWQRARALLARMESLYEQTQHAELQPHTMVFSQIFQILSICQDPEAAIHAKELLKKMNVLAKAGFPHASPDATTYAYLINTFTKSKVENASELATRILEDVEEGYRMGQGHLRPVPLLYSAVLQAHAKSASPLGAERAENLLQRCKQLYKEQGRIYAKPTTPFYNAVIDAHARSQGGVPAAERAEELLQEIETKSRAGDLDVSQQTRSFNAAILAWKNSNATEAPQRAEALLKQMNEKGKAGCKGCRPDQVTLNLIIGVWAKSHADGAAERAEAFLMFMEDMNEAGDLSLKPDSYSFNTVIDAYARIGNAEKAESLYQRMLQLYENGNHDTRPDIVTLTSLRNAWVRIDDATAQKKAREMEELILLQSQNEFAANPTLDPQGEASSHATERRPS